MHQNHKEMLLETLHQFVDLFTETDTELGKTHLVELKLDTGNQPRIRQRPYRTPLAQRGRVERHLLSLYSFQRSSYLVCI